MGVKRSVTIRGVSYPSHAEAAEALGLAVTTISSAVSSGRLETVGLRNSGRAVSVEIEGVTYPNLRAAGAAFGVSPQLVRSAMLDGTLATLRERAARKRPAQPVNVCGVTYPSMYKCAQALGVSVGRVKKAIERGAEDELVPAQPIASPVPHAPLCARDWYDDVRHPRWTSEQDLRLVKMRGKGESFHGIAAFLGLAARAVEQRWHRLRVLHNVEARLAELVAEAAFQ